MISLIVVRLIQNKIVDYQNEHNIKNKKECYWKMGLTGERIKDALNNIEVIHISRDSSCIGSIDNWKEPIYQCHLLS